MAVAVVKSAAKYSCEAPARVAVDNGDSATPATNGPVAAATHYHPGKLDIYFLEITLVVSGQYFSWNLGLSSGLYSYLIIYVIMGLAYVTFCCCMAEVTSALPFAGGAYGLASCTLGFFPAFLIGCCETIEYIASVAVIVLALADLFTLMLPSLATVKPVVWLAFYISSVSLQIRGHGAFWITSLVVGSMSLVILLLYCFRVLGQVDLKANALQDPAQLHAGGFHGALIVLPFSAWCFLGIEALNLASDDVKHPKKQIPGAQVASICILFATGLFTVLTTVSLPHEGGIAALSKDLAPLNNGFIRMLKVHVDIATLLTIPSQYAAAYGLSWAQSKLIHGMAASKLLPPALAATTARYGTPYMASLTDAVLGHLICVLIYVEPVLQGYLLPLCLLFAFASYAGQCIGYISLRHNYPLVRCGHSAIRLASSVPYGSQYSVLLFVATLVLLSIYYVLFAKTRQIMSEEESKALLKAHILKFNAKRHTTHTKTCGFSKVISTLTTSKKTQRSAVTSTRS